MFTTLDAVILVVYFVGLIGLSIYLGREHHSQKDYFLGGRRVPSWAIGTSIMATQAGVISMISAPAFVAIRPNGGLTWLQYEFALPLAMIPLMAVLIPFFYRSEIVTIYEYLERRFDAPTRSVFSLVFQLSRGLATGVSIYAAGILLSVVLDAPLWLCILLMGVIALVYTAIGGIAAVIWSDVIQLAILWIGSFVVMGFILEQGGGWSRIISQIPAERFDAINVTSHGLGDAETFGFWPMVIGGLFLYAAYYGCDQSQTQRVLSAESEDKARQALWINGLLRFPLVLSYGLVGVLLAGFVAEQPGFLDLVPDEHPDYLVPMFIKEYVPTGLTGFILAAMFAAVMSSIDSAFSSLSAASVNDFYIRHVNPDAGHRQYLFWSRVTTVLWGVACTGFAFIVGELAPTVIEAINKVGSLFFGPTLAAFLLATLSRRATGHGIIWGLLAGVGLNLVLWIWFSPAVSWLWWNVLGCLAALAVAYPVSLCDTPPAPRQVKDLVLDRDRARRILKDGGARYPILAGYFLFIILLSMGLEWLPTWLPSR